MSDQDILDALEFEPTARCDVRHRDYHRAVQILRWACDNCGASSTLALCSRCYQFASTGTLTCHECAQAATAQRSIKHRIELS